ARPGAAERATWTRKEATMDVTEVLTEIGALRDDAVRAVNARSGDDHAVKLGDLRTLAKRIKTDHELARALWNTGDPDARLLATPICRPKAFSPDELDTMVREARTPKLLDWLVSYVVKASR